MGLSDSEKKREMDLMVPAGPDRVMGHKPDRCFSEAQRHLVRSRFESIRTDLLTLNVTYYGSFAPKKKPYYSSLHPLAANMYLLRLQGD